MQTKLTLTIDQAIIMKAKKYAQEKHKSVSKIVEEYLRNLSEKNGFFIPSKPLEAPITDSIAGMFPDSGKDYKTMLDEARIEKFK